METGSLIVIVLALLRVLPVVLGPKPCRKVGVGAMLLELKAQIPENGIGPVIAQRRGAVACLEENWRQCGRSRQGRDA
jgi:hypothetical protein